jgi:hypothetical protein
MSVASRALLRVISWREIIGTALLSAVFTLVSSLWIESLVHRVPWRAVLRQDSAVALWAACCIGVVVAMFRTLGRFRAQGFAQRLQTIGKLNQDTLTVLECIVDCPAREHNNKLLAVKACEHIQRVLEDVPDIYRASGPALLVSCSFQRESRSGEEE